MGNQLWQRGTSYGALHGPRETIYIATYSPGVPYIVAIHGLGPGGTAIRGNHS